MLAGNISQADRHSSDSGGTTGVRMTFHRDNASLAPKYAATFRQERWTGWNLGERVGLVWPARQDYVGAWTLKARLRNALSHRYLTLPAALLSEMEIQSYCNRLQKFQPTKIRAFPYALMPVVEYLLEHKEYTIRPKGIIVTGEPLYEHQRKMMEEAFACPVFDSYGSRETGLIAQECEEHKGMHLNFESLVVEYIGENGLPVADGETGELIITDLFNYGMPLVRYSLGDMGVPLNEPCPCGRGLPMMSGVQGRVVDHVVLAGGRRVSPSSLVLYLVDNGPPVGQVQVIQDKIDHLIIKMTNDPTPDERVFDYYRQTVHELLGDDMQLTFEVVKEIPREKSGKYRFVKSLL